MRPLFIILLCVATPVLNAQSTNRGVQLFESSDWARAKTELTSVLQRNDRDARDALADFYSMAPTAMGGGADKAREQADAIARLDAMRGHFALGRLATRANDGATVEREMNAAIAAAPDTLRIYSALANWYASQKQWPQAFATIDRYIKRRPSDPHGPNAFGRIAAASGQQLERGEQGIKAFVAKPPKDVSPALLSLAYLRLGQVLRQEGKSAEARVYFEQAIRIDPRNEDAKKEIK